MIVNHIDTQFNPIGGRYYAHVLIDQQPHVLSCGPNGAHAQPVNFLEPQMAWPRLNKGDHVQLQGRRFQLVANSVTLWGCRLAEHAE